MKSNVYLINNDVYSSLSSSSLPESWSEKKREILNTFFTYRKFQFAARLHFVWTKIYIFEIIQIWNGQNNDWLKTEKCWNNSDNTNSYFVRQCTVHSVVVMAYYIYIYIYFAPQQTIVPSTNSNDEMWTPCNEFWWSALFWSPSHLFTRNVLFWTLSFRITFPQEPILVWIVRFLFGFQSSRNEKLMSNRLKLVEYFVVFLEVQHHLNKTRAFGFFL